jgi:uncharacterized glyoxalase superfamily protein PhnB
VNAASSRVWPTLLYDDARAAIAWLKDALGFEEVLVVPDDDDKEVVVHAELKWPEGGGIMMGSRGAGQEPFTNLPSGASSVYVVTDEPDRLYEQATRAGAKVERELRDEDYGSRGFTVRDPEGNLWSFGTYAGEAE